MSVTFRVHTLGHRMRRPAPVAVACPARLALPRTGTSRLTACFGRQHPLRQSQPSQQ